MADPEVNEDGDTAIGKAVDGQTVYKDKTTGKTYTYKPIKWPEKTIKDLENKIKKEFEEKRLEEEARKKKEEENLKDSNGKEANIDKELDPFDPYEWFVKKTLRRDVNVSQ